MGRIADALKRAQDERARRLEQGIESDVVRSGVMPAEQAVESGAAPDGQEAEHLLGRMSFAQPSSKPFATQMSPIDSEHVDSRIVSLHDPKGTLAEKYRSVRTRLLTENPTGSARIFGVTSSVPKEGKTVTAGNLAFALSELKHLRVAMIDFDLHGKGLSRLFGVEDAAGIAEVLRGEKRLADVCVPVVRQNLYMIPAGDSDDINLSELISQSPAAALFKEFSERFHYSLVDTPPVDVVSDIGLIAPLCHSVVMVIRMNRTPEAVLRRCVKMLQVNHVSIAGSILTGYDERAAGYSDTHDYLESSAV
jgi:capsular exopolysaccharide synthesis family protein